MRTGLGTPNQMREYVKDGTVKKFALSNPEDLGYLAAYATNALITGEFGAMRVTSSPPTTSDASPSARGRRCCSVIRSRSTSAILTNSSAIGKRSS